jgi:hypothetical protein
MIGGEIAALVPILLKTIIKSRHALSKDGSTMILQENSL